MANDKTQFISKGFWAGVGLIAPVAFAILIGNQLTRYSDTAFSAEDYEQEESYSELFTDHSQSIAVDHFKDQRDGEKVNILGSITNKGSTTVGSIRLEAEFFDDKGDFVYEQSEYINKKLAPNESENFLIACGCKDKNFPEYKSVTVRVVGAHDF